MMGDGEDDSASLDSDSDLGLLDGADGGPVGGGMGVMLDSDEDDDDDDDDELEVNQMAAETLKNRKSAKPMANGAVVSAAAAGFNSDDDF